MTVSYDQHLQDQEIANEDVEPREGECGGCEKEAVLNENNYCLKCENDHSEFLEALDHGFDCHKATLSVKDGKIVLSARDSSHRIIFDGEINLKTFFVTKDYTVKEVD